MAHTEEKPVEETIITESQPQQQVVKTTKTVIKEPEVKTEHPQKIFEKKKTIFRTYQITWYILGIVEVLLGFRIALKVVGANPASGFATLIYALTDPLALPFVGILKPTVIGSSVFEWSTYIAAVVYWLLAYGLVQLFQMIKPVTPKEVEEEV